MDKQICLKDGVSSLMVLFSNYNNLFIFNILVEKIIAIKIH